ncbi:MAG TPA: SIMPL domain-containing protein [Bacteroidia bacterium]|nr:SIMPL domain-containing protein [Bacteroidia bacterium]
MIKSEGEVETLPDEASFYIELSCIDKSIKVSKNCLVDKSNNLINTLLKFEIRKDDILTTAVNMSKSYTWKFNSNVFEGYRSSTTVYVTVKDIEKLDDIYTELMENQNLDLGGLSYSHSKLDSLKNEAYVKALEKAGILADKLLEKLPESKKEILKIGNVEIKASYPKDEESNFELKERAANINMNANNSIAISKGTVLVTATLFVEYQIR